MRFIIYGAGAVGSSLGGYLAQAGYSSILIGRSQHVSQIQRNGLAIKDTDGKHNIMVEAVDSLDSITWDPEDIVCLCVKSQDTNNAVTDLSRWARPVLPIFCFQNGVHNEEAVARVFDNVYGVLVAVGVRLVAPGQIVHYEPKAFTLGRYPNGLDNRTEQVGAALQDAGYTVTLDTDTMAAKWSKLIMNLSNAFYAITGLSILEARNIPEARFFLADLFEEGVSVLEAAGIRYEAIPNRLNPRETVDRLRTAQKARALPEDSDFYYYPSTWQDLQLQRGTTEAASFNGEIITLGQSAEVATPINSLLMSLVEQMAANHENPGKYGVEELRQMLD